jgi:cholesterol oxidase
VSDVLVIGSGFGGGVAALRLAEKGYRVTVLEAGRRFRPEDFPRTSWRLRRFMWAPRLGCFGIQRVTRLRDVVVLSGAGVGGGSLVYAGVLWEPPASVWPDPARGRELAPFYAKAREVLGVVETPVEGPADELLRQVGNELGVGSTWARTPVGIRFGEGGCVACGGCMVGCRYGAKNSVDLTYLRRAEELGARVLAETEATRVVPLPGGGFEVETQRPGRRGGEQRLRAEQVVLAAGTLGTLRLLLRSGLGGPGVGRGLRTNSESIVGASALRPPADFTRGVAIGSSLALDEHTTVEAVRYSRGSNAMGLLGTILPDEPGARGFARTALRRPHLALGSLSVRRWSERTVIFLVMQSRPGELRAVLRDGKLTTEVGGAPVTGSAEAAHLVARTAARLIRGVPGGSLNEALLGIPMTAHVLGGATEEHGVVDGFGRVLSQPGLHVVDGAAVGANLGVNPSLTIAAQAEHALESWPAAG